MHGNAHFPGDERENLREVWKAITMGNRHIMDIYEKSGLSFFWPMAHTCLLLLMQQGYITINDGFDEVEVTKKGIEACAVPDIVPWTHEA